MSDSQPLLSPLERRTLANQYRILAKVDPDDSAYYRYEQIVEILESGFEAEYHRVLGRVQENRLSDEECGLVADTLVMASTLLDHKGETNVDLSEWEQVGFDHNRETLHLRYARFLVEDMESNLPGIKGVVDNHRPSLGRYRRMVAAWRASEHPAALTEADVARIITAGLNLPDE